MGQIYTILNQQKHANTMVVAILVDAVTKKIFESSESNVTLIGNQNVKFFRHCDVSCRITMS